MGIEPYSRLAGTGPSWIVPALARTRNSPERKTANPLGLAVSLYLLVVMGRNQGLLKKCY